MRDAVSAVTMRRARLYAASTAAELARFSLGRVLLHLIAALGDGAVRFHGAGILRELSQVGDATVQLLLRAAGAGLRTEK